MSDLCISSFCLFSLLPPTAPTILYQRMLISCLSPRSLSFFTLRAPKRGGRNAVGVVQRAFLWPLTAARLGHSSRVRNVGFLLFGKGITFTTSTRQYDGMDQIDATTNVDKNRQSYRVLITTDYIGLRASMAIGVLLLPCIDRPCPPTS